MEKVKEATSESKAPPAPQVDEQPKLPEEQNGPQMLSHLPDAGMPSATRAGEMLASPRSDLGAPTRARMGSMLQRQVGNTWVGRTFAPTVQAKRTVAAPDDIGEQETDSVADGVGKTPAA